MNLTRPSLFLPRPFVAREKVRRKKFRQTAAYGLQRHVTNLIQDHYPEHLFTVEVMPETGNILIDHPLLKNAGARYFCRYSAFEQSQGMAVIKLAGEILERVNMRAPSFSTTRTTTTSVSSKPPRPSSPRRPMVLVENRDPLEARLDPDWLDGPLKPLRESVSEELYRRRTGR